ncbi:MAG: 30S ribosomal protein S20 [Mariniblastus sp.]|nr:30S ribosomal protein S20 [Mariniblastus sp.]MDG1511793.1 30S ribosomal protein S20 [Mariniblastus sp.]MDG2180703.1 30S ribosomal protein S20 [Mariniblastus sp.]
MFDSQISTQPRQQIYRQMPNTASASKRLRQTKVRQARNKATKTAMKSQVKKVLSLASEGNVEQAEVEFKLAAKRLDRAGAKGIIHKNAAGRQKSRLQRAIKKAKN